MVCTWPKLNSPRMDDVAWSFTRSTVRPLVEEKSAFGCASTGAFATAELAAHTRVPARLVTWTTTSPCMGSTTALEPGMILSNEPGYYYAGHWGKALLGLGHRGLDLVRCARHQRTMHQVHERHARKGEHHRDGEYEEQRQSRPDGQLT